jgi:hypothetical protein
MTHGGQSANRTCRNVVSMDFFFIGNSRFRCLISTGNVARILIKQRYLSVMLVAAFRKPPVIL